MKKYSVFIIVCLVMLLAAAAGCGRGTPEDQASKGPAAGKEDYPVTVVDSLNRQVTIEKQPQKIISLSPAITEILFAIGAGDRVTGVTEYCDYPAEALNKPKVGSFQNPNLELIISGKPDVIFVAAGIQEDFVKQFNELGIRVVTLDAENIGQVLDNIKLAGTVTGDRARSEQVVSGLEKRIAAVRERVAGADTRPAVFFEVWDEPLMTAGPGSFIDDLITTAGGKNIASDAVKRFAEFSREMLIERNPDIYILNSHAHKPEDVKKRAGYSGLKAVKENRVYTIEDDLVTLPGPRIVEGLEEVAKIIHPEVF